MKKDTASKPKPTTQAQLADFLSKAASAEKTVQASKLQLRKAKAAVKAARDAHRTAKDLAKSATKAAKSAKKYFEKHSEKPSKGSEKDKLAKLTRSKKKLARVQRLKRTLVTSPSPLPNVPPLVPHNR